MKLNTPVIAIHSSCYSSETKHFFKYEEKSLPFTEGTEVLQAIIRLKDKVSLFKEKANNLRR